MLPLSLPIVILAIPTIITAIMRAEVFPFGDNERQEEFYQSLFNMRDKRKDLFTQHESCAGKSFN